ncbi:MAG TPA: protein phosphatase 2C domain-containing protein [Sandaracinaceae bacterium LLY-WYZ-13_1]|nr:protein phosphatase 2C domain-containing protein [Sandaracinaceae bacterium LLY-WYZ-13_1]
MRIEHEGRSDTGRRENNEDAWLALPERGLYAVADGMGGYEGGEVASRLALASLQTYFELLGEDGLGLCEPGGEGVARERVALAIRIADREVSRRARGRLSKMGTTLACLFLQGDRALIAHVGDSRVYRMRDGELEALTRDHSLYSEMESAGLAGLPPRTSFHFSNVITQALGQGPDVRPDVTLVSVLPGDRFLLCSDGVTDVLDEESIAWFLTRTEGTARELVEGAYDHGGLDNITAVVVTAR